MFPIIVVNISLKNFLNYKFHNSNVINKKREIKLLTYPLISILFLLAILINLYFLYTFELFNPFLIENNFINLKFNIFVFLFIIIILLVNNTKKYLKRIILINFLVISIILWTKYYINLLEINNIFSNFFSNISYPNIKVMNIFNVIFLLIIEILYYCWCYLSYKDNLSNWCVPYPTKLDLKPIIKLLIFYIGILIYYLIFNQIS